MCTQVAKGGTSQTRFLCNMSAALLASWLFWGYNWSSYEFQHLKITSMNSLLPAKNCTWDIFFSETLSDGVTTDVLIIKQ